MSLIELWENSRNQLEGKQVQQIIAFAGTGQLRDNSTASEEFRAYLNHVPSPLLRVYADQCLQESFTGSGFALQDIINQVGRRLGFKVADGRYRGAVGQTGFDGLWMFPGGHTIVVEVKTTDTYRIDLNTLAEYRRSVIKAGSASETESSILIVVGREDTGDLEAQIRGSRHAWDIRLISIDALLRLMSLKEEIEDPRIINQIHNILIPREFTKLDDIVGLVFSTAEDIKPESEKREEVDSSASDVSEEVQEAPVSFYDACIARAESFLKKSLVKRTRTTYASPDGTVGLTCAVSKTYLKRGDNWYWFAFHRHHKEFLDQSNQGYVTLDCGSEENLLLIPFHVFCQWLDDLNTTDNESRFYWHLNISMSGNDFLLHRKRGLVPTNLSKYLVPSK